MENKKSRGALLGISKFAISGRVEVDFLCEFFIKLFRCLLPQKYRQSQKHAYYTENEATYSANS